MRIAAIDVGSNSIHLVVVEADALGNQQVLAREKHMVRLARGVLRTGEIGPEAFEAGLSALALMAEVVRGLGCETIMACGTAALREAANAPAFIAAAAGLGIAIKVISGEEEAALIYLAVSRAIPFPEEPTVLVDIGGGSTELTWLVGGPGHRLRVPGLGPPAAGGRRAHLRPAPARGQLVRLRKFIRKVLKKARKALPRRPARRPAGPGHLRHPPGPGQGRQRPGRLQPATAAQVQAPAVEGHGPGPGGGPGGGPQARRGAARGRQLGHGPAGVAGGGAGPLPAGGAAGRDGLEGPGPRRHGPAAAGRPAPGHGGGAGRQAGP